jgi:hypothetical protein
MVEQLTLNQLVPGSSPGGATISFVFSQILHGKRVIFSRRRSSMVEHLFCKQAVAGSNPIAGSIFPRRRELGSFARGARQIFSLPDGVMVARTTLTRSV